MSVWSLPKNNTVRLPIEVALYNGASPRAGEAGDLSISVYSMETGLKLDFDDDAFKASPTTPTGDLTANLTDKPHVYQHVLSPGGWPRGNYQAFVNHAISNEEWSFDFSVGLYVNRTLQQAVTYRDNQPLRLSLWIDENGERQSDYEDIRDCILLDKDGTQTFDMGDATPGSNGVFTIEYAMNFEEATAYILTCKAVVAGHAGQPNYEFKLGSGLVRP